MANKMLDVMIDDKEVYQMLTSLLNRIDHPEALLYNIGIYIQEQTGKMFKGRRPDNGEVRGVSWPKLKEKTILQKRKLKKDGKAIATDRPLVRTGELRDDLLAPRAIKIKKTGILSSKSGLEYGTDRRSKENFPYPTAHELGTPKIPQRKWLFLTTKDLEKMARMTKKFLIAWKRGLKESARMASEGE